jgi:hypothetical protein
MEIVATPSPVIICLRAAVCICASGQGAVSASGGNAEGIRESWLSVRPQAEGLHHGPASDDPGVRSLSWWFTAADFLLLWRPLLCTAPKMNCSHRFVPKYHLLSEWTREQMRIPHWLWIWVMDSATGCDPYSSRALDVPWSLSPMHREPPRSKPFLVALVVI